MPDRAAFSGPLHFLPSLVYLRSLEKCRLASDGGHIQAGDFLGRMPIRPEGPTDQGNAEVVTAPLEVGADLEAKGKYGLTPLHWAARGGTAEVVMTLLEAGANPAARDNDRELPVDHAESNDQLKGTDAYWKLNDARFQ